MCETLTEEEIKLYDSFISKNGASSSKEFNIPNQARREGREMYKQLIKSTTHQLYVLYSEAMWLSSYSLYKSSNNKMYIIYTYANIPHRYYIL
jgi:hypothetical protein